MIILKKVSWNDGRALKSCDFSRKGKCAAIFNFPDGTAKIGVDDNLYNFPRGWDAADSRVNWVGEGQLLISSIKIPKGVTSYLWRIGDVWPKSSKYVEIKFDLSISISGSVIACSYPEDWFRPGNEKLDQFDIISIYEVDGDKIKKTNRFFDVYLKSYSNFPLLEVEHLVCDDNRRAVWFVAYGSDHIWNYSFDAEEAIVGNLEIPQTQVLSIACLNDMALVISTDNDQIYELTYCLVGGKIELVEKKTLRIDRYFPMENVGSLSWVGYDNICFAVYSNLGAFLIRA